MGRPVTGHDHSQCSDLCILLQFVLANVSSYHAAISACEKAMQPDKALGLLEVMRRKDLKPDVIMYNAAIELSEGQAVGQVVRAS